MTADAGRRGKLSQYPLDLSHNRLTYLPPELGNLTPLTALNLYDNRRGG